MAERKRIILVGPACSGKTYIKNKFVEKGFEPEVTYTTRPPREGEVNGKDYHFISVSEFIDRMNGRIGSGMYETAKHGDYWYGTSLAEWEHSEIFIMETHGISQISPEDRKNCFIIYVNTPWPVRLRRMEDRGWKDDNISHRALMDQEKFKDFKDFDLEIQS